MPVGHQRINNPRPWPNDEITFISSMQAFPDHEKAKDILYAVAAQFKPICKRWGLGVNSLEEHEWNTEFAGRNFNGGEIIQLVLRRPNGSFMPMEFILRVMAHELAHIKQMNHSVYFHRTNNRFLKELRDLQERGYTGDGFWSKGRELLSGMPKKGDVPATDLPQYICGGARQRNVDPSHYPRRRGGWRFRPRTPKELEAAAHATKRKPGSRVQSAYAFGSGPGRTLSEDPEDSSFRKQAASKKAANLRYEAAEKRRKAEMKQQKRDKRKGPLDKAFDKTSTGAAASSSSPKKKKKAVLNTTRRSSTGEIVDISSDDDSDSDLDEVPTDSEDEEGLFEEGPYTWGSRDDVYDDPPTDDEDDDVELSPKSPPKRTIQASASSLSPSKKKKTTAIKVIEIDSD